MKLLHTSDWHLGAFDGEHSLYDDQKYFIDQISDIVKRKNIDAVLIAGDVYDRSVASAEAASLYDYAMTKLCKECKAKVITIAGNHDSAERLANCNELLSEAGLYIKGELTADLSPVDFDGVQIYMLPWITEEKVKSVFPEEKENIKSLADAYRIVSDKMKQSFSAAKKHIILSHAFITDSETSVSDRAAVIGTAAQVPASVFDGFDYAALGHIHKPQDITESVRYSGTPMPYSFGKEEQQEKSVTIIDTDTMEKEIAVLSLLHKRITIEGTLNELLNPNCSDDIRNGYVRLIATDSYIGPELINELYRVYPNYLIISGKTYESENSEVILSIEDFERLEADPIEIFRHFCVDETGEEPDEHKLSLFRNAINGYKEGDSV